MITTFDLDGVIADTDKWFFRMLNIVQFNAAHLQMELDYYANRPLKHHPNLFMTNNDVGYIITARKPYAEKITRRWLKKYGITLPILFVDHNDEIDWTSYEKASVIAARAKAEVLNDLSSLHMGGLVHFDNNPFIIRELRAEGIVAILIGGNQLEEES